jgi:type IV pilus assembly protein PilB
MKIEPFLIASSLNMVLSQRLVRKVCPKCRQEVLFPPEAETKLIETLSKPHLNIDLEKYRDKPTGRLKFFRGTGCAYCRQEGYRGRSAVYEIF